MISCLVLRREILQSAHSAYGPCVVDKKFVYLRAAGETWEWWNLFSRASEAASDLLPGQSPKILQCKKRLICASQESIVFKLVAMVTWQCRRFMTSKTRAEEECCSEAPHNQKRNML